MSTVDNMDVVPSRFLGICNIISRNTLLGGLEVSEHKYRGGNGLIGT